MKKIVLGENKLSRFTEILFLIQVPAILYFYAKQAKINHWGLLIILLGFVLFLIAKISVIRKQHYFTFGCDNMSKAMMISYFFGYVFMIVGYLVTFSVIF